MLKLKFNQNFKKSIYLLLINSNKLKFTIQTSKDILYINEVDLEYIDKVLERNLIKYKLILAIIMVNSYRVNFNGNQNK